METCKSYKMVTPSGLVFDVDTVGDTWTLNTPCGSNVTVKDGEGTCEEMVGSHFMNCADCLRTSR